MTDSGRNTPASVSAPREDLEVRGCGRGVRLGRTHHSDTMGVVLPPGDGDGTHCLRSGTGWDSAENGHHH